MTAMTEDERRQIITLLAGGASCREVARITHRAPSTISATARQSGINIQDLTHNRDRKRLDEALARSQRLLDALDDPGKVGKWALALAAIMDEPSTNYSPPRTPKKERGVV